jgi:hypothetical protein
MTARRNRAIRANIFGETRASSLKRRSTSSPVHHDGTGGASHSGFARELARSQGKPVIGSACGMR